MGKRKVAIEVGALFDRLVVLDLLPPMKGHYMARCRCQCGKEIHCRVSGLVSGHNKSCGCRHDEILKKGARYTHGKARSRFYKAWAGMIQRCENQNHTKFKDYGGRGIKVCEEWHSFENFYEWAMANGWEPSLQIDRINNDGDYCPDNCQWITVQQNSRNKRSSHLISINGVTRTLIEWSERTGIACSTIISRINRGWSETMLLSPVRSV